MKWYHYVIFPFLKTHIYIDDGGLFDNTTVIHYKIFRGLKFIIKRASYITPPMHFNCRCIVAPNGKDLK